MNSKSWTPSYIQVAALLLMFRLASASTSASEVTCSAARNADGTFTYTLSPELWTLKCRPKWTSENGTNLAHGLKFDNKTVKNVTINSITLKHCQSHLDFFWQCGKVREKANCSFNCNLPYGSIQQSTASPPTVIKVCLSETFCVEQWKLCVSIGIPAACLLAIAFVGVFLWKIITKRRRSADQTTTYSAVNDENKLEEGQFDEQV